MINTYFRDYLGRYQPFKDYWNYEDGCVLLGCKRMYQACGDALYADFVLRYLSERVLPDGSIPGYPEDRCALDSFNSGKLLFFAEQLTGDPRYRKAAAWLAGQIRKHPRTKSGFFWHKQIYPEQIWIDGIYMAAPFFAEYAAVCGAPRIYGCIREWFAYIRSHMRSPENGLYYHALDETRSQAWADPETGLSRSHWLRGEGWFLMALTDTIALLPPEQTDLRAFLAEILKEAVTALLPFRTADGMLCQLIDRPELPGNYTETSGTLMAAYALMAGAAAGVLPPSFSADGAAMLEAVIREKLRPSAGSFTLTGICSAAGLGGTPPRDGTPAYYLSEPVVSDDPKGTGALMMAYAEKTMQKKSQNQI